MSKVAQMSVSFPKVKPEKKCDMKCTKNCPPILSQGCDDCCWCGDYYINPMCNFVGITGLVEEDQCMMFDERYGGCGDCIGCVRECQGMGYCPINSSYY